MNAPAVTEVRLVPASIEQRRTGLRGFISCRYGDLMLDGIALRRTADGRLKLSFPSRRDRAGRDHPYVRPLDNEARRAIEEQVLAALREDHGQSVPIDAAYDGSSTNNPGS